MIKVHWLLRSPEREPFAARGAAARQVAESSFNGLLGLIQTRACEEQLRGPVPYQGVLEAWFASLPDAVGAASAAARSGLLAAPTEIEALVLGRERTVLRTVDFAHGTGVKCVFPFRRRADLAVPQFQHYWWHEHGPIAARTQDATGYLQTHPVDADTDPGGVAYDGVTELFWPDVAAARAAMTSAQMTQDQADDAQHFVDPDSVVVLLAEEEVLIRP